jgi:hypothetical protein
MGTQDSDLKAVARALLQLKVRTGALLKRTSGAKELRDAEKAASLLEVAVVKASSGRLLNLQAGLGIVFGSCVCERLSRGAHASLFRGLNKHRMAPWHHLTLHSSSQQAWVPCCQILQLVCATTS